MDVFDLQAKITLDSTGFESGLNAAAGQMESFGSRIEGIMSKVGSVIKTGFATAATGVSALITGATTQFAEFEQLVGGVDTLFKESSGTLQEYADAAFKTAGLSANDYMDTATSFAASLIQALGGDTAAAVDMVDMAVVDMADNANKMGTDIGSIQHAYQGFAKQNYTMLDNLKLGYGGTKSEMARLINDTGILGDTIVEVSTMTKQGNFDSVVSFDVVVDAIHAVQESMGITGTTAQEAAQTIEGSVASMKAAWSNWLVGLADENADLSGLTDNLIGSFETVVQNVQPVIGRIKDSILQVFTDLTGIDLSPVTAAFDGLQTVLSDVGTSFTEGGATAAFDTITEKLSELTGLDLSGVSEAFTGLSEAISAIGAGFAEGGLEGGFDALVRQIEQLTGLDLSGVTESFTLFGEAFSEIAGAFADGGISGGIDALVQAFEDLTGIDLSGLASGIREFLGEFGVVDSGTLASVQNAIGAIVNAFSGVDLSGAINLAADALGLFLGAVNEIAGSAIAFLAEIVAQLARDFNTWAPGVAAVVAGIAAFMGYLGMVHLIQNMTSALSLLQGGFTALNAVMAANPIGLIISLVAGLAAALVTAYATNEDFRNSVQQTWETIKEGAIGVFEAFKDTLANIGEAISEAAGAIKDKVGEFIQAGANLIQGFVSGITEKLAAAKETITGAFGKVTDWVKGVFDINSPSKVFSEVGRNLMRGLALGVDDESGIVQDAIDKMHLTVPAITTGRVDFANSAIGKSSAATIGSMFSSASQGGGVYNINLNVDGRTVANVVFDPLNSLIKQKGVTLGA